MRPSALVLAQSGPFVCYYCTRAHEVRVQLPRRTLSLDADRPSLLLKAVAGIPSGPEEGDTEVCPDLGPDEWRVLGEPIPPACAALLLLIPPRCDRPSPWAPGPVAPLRGIVRTQGGSRGTHTPPNDIQRQGAHEPATAATSAG